MKWPRCIITAVILGLVVNVGVAWGISAWANWKFEMSVTAKNQLPPGAPRITPEEWLILSPANGNAGQPNPIFDVRSEFGEESDPEPYIKATCISFKGFGTSYVETAVEQYVRWIGSGDTRSLRYAEIGWPTASFSWAAMQILPKTETPVAGSLPTPAWLRPIDRTARLGGITKTSYLPLRPIFPGVVVNTLSYAAMIFVLMLIASSIRRFIRTRTGRCPSCGYNRTGLASPSTPCPECGAATTLAPTPVPPTSPTPR